MNPLNDKELYVEVLQKIGWLVIPPLDTPEGREAVERALHAWCFDPKGDGGPIAMAAALRAAGERS